MSVMRTTVKNLSKLVVFAAVSVVLVMLAAGDSQVYATHAIIDSILVHDRPAGFFVQADVVALTGDIYAVAFDDSDTDSVQLSTYSINPDGSNITLIDNATVIGGNSVSAVKVADDIVAIAYEKFGAGDPGVAITTVEIDSLGMITGNIQTVDVGDLSGGIRGINFIRSHHNNDIFVILNEDEVGPADIDILIKTVDIDSAG